MWFKLLLLVCISSTFISYGALWYRKSLSSEDRYDLTEDARRSFLAPRWKYSSHASDGKPRRIVPAMIILGGIAILAVGLMKML
jgi:hypothetical protein